jgi:N-acetylmuramoyl-L-alanine amidase
MLKKYFLLALSAIVFILVASAFTNSTPIYNDDNDNNQFIIVLDAGHGGKDPGAIGSRPTNREKDINLGIVLKIGEFLKKNCPDVKVVYTRTKDVFVELGERANIANKAKANLFVSVHTNALPKGRNQVTGVQSYSLTLRTAKENLEVEKRENSVVQYEANGAQKYSFMNNSSESMIMFELMQQHDMANSVEFSKLAQEEMVKGGRRNKGVLQANLAVLRLTYMPSVLLEVGYISTPSEEKFLLSDDGQTTMAKCIYNAIVRYKAQHTGRMSKLEKITQEKEQQQVKEQQQKETENKSETAKQTETAPVSNNAANAVEARPYFFIQVMATDKKISEIDKQLKGLKNLEIVHDGKFYKYLYGKDTDYMKVKSLKKEVVKSFPNCYIVAMKEGKFMNTTEAINEWKNIRISSN